MKNRNVEIDDLLKEVFLNSDLNDPKNESLVLASSKLLLNNKSSIFSLKNRFNLWIGIVTLFGLLTIVLLSNLNEVKPHYEPQRLQLRIAENKDLRILSKMDLNSFSTLKVISSERLPKYASLEPLTFNSLENFKDTVKVYTPLNDGVLPELTEEQIKVHYKEKKNYLKDLFKLSKSRFSKIDLPLKNDFDLNENFAVWKGEITNYEYKLFLNDLIVSEEKEKYNKAKIVDIAWYDIFGKIAFMEPMVKHYSSHEAYNNYPVVNIARDGAILFCEWLTQEIKKSDKNKEFLNEVRIPTINEWMYAASSGNKKYKYSWGGPYLRNVRGCYLANFKPGIVEEIPCLEKMNTNQIKIAENFKDNPYAGDGGLFTVSSISYAPNDFELYNMSGNVAEMVFYPKSMEVGAKGGSWSDEAYYLQIKAEDNYKGIVNPKPTIGFRPIITFLAQ